MSTPSATPGCRATPVASAARSRGCTAPTSSPTPTRWVSESILRSSTPCVSMAASFGGRAPNPAQPSRSTSGRVTWSPRLSRSAVLQYRNQKELSMSYDPEQEPYVALRTKALESLLIEKGLVIAEVIDAEIEKYEQDIG